jgi:hypothetical protein
VGGMGWGMGGSEVASLSHKLPRHVASVGSRQGKGAHKGK